MRKKKEAKSSVSTMSTKDGYIGLFIESDLKTRCENEARRMDVPLSMLVRKALKAYLVQLSGEAGVD